MQQVIPRFTNKFISLSQLIAMIKFTRVKKATAFSLILVAVLFLIVQSCKPKRSEMADALFKKTHNKVFQEVTPDGFSLVFKKVLAAKAAKLPHADLILSYYQQHNFTPVFVLNHLFNHDLDTALDFFSRAGEHGLNPEMFESERISALLDSFKSINGIKTVDEAYEDMAEVEVAAAGSLIKYSNALQYGILNPKKLYQRYFMVTKRPDTTSMEQVFKIGDMQAYLDSIQPKDPQYIALQEALKSGVAAPGKSPEETKRILLVNLERLRWRNKPNEKRYVMVNIPDFTLNVIDSGKTVLDMKVCVGEGRNMLNANTLMAYADSCKIDSPFEHETPLLNSVIHSVQVNPVWNIPRSIANKEIIVEAAKDRFYLSNKGINVFKNDKLISNPERIDWSKVTRENNVYEFKQKPGNDNSLGKIKFLFKNQSSVYLHDTPVKWAFGKKMRAVSHGCVRLGDPQALALNLFGPGDKFDMISKDMAANNPDPTTIWLPKKTPVYITYVTCWYDEDKGLQVRNDVYGLDIVLYDHLKKYLPKDN